MQVNPNHNVGPVYTPKNVASSAPARVSDQGQAMFGSSEALNAALSQAPDVRPDQVEKAKSLIADVNYPPVEAIKKISQLLAIGLTSPEQ